MTLATASPLGSTHIPALDAHFFATVNHHPSPLSSLNRGDVIEIQGPTCSGKTSLVYHLLMTCIIPTSQGGWGKSACVFDTDGAFDIIRLSHLILSRLVELSLPLETAKELAEFGLQNLHIFRPTSSIQLAATLVNLPAYQTSNLPDSEVAMVVVDSVSAFYWPDRFTVEQARGPDDSSKSNDTIHNPLHHVLAALQAYRVSHNPVMILTNWGLNPIAKPDSPISTPFYRQHLFPFPSPFTAPRPDTSASDYAPHTLSLTHHITLPFLALARPNANATIEEFAVMGGTGKKEGTTGLVRTPGNVRVDQFTFHIV